LLTPLQIIEPVRQIWTASGTDELLQMKLTQIAADAGNVLWGSACFCDVFTFLGNTWVEVGGVCWPQIITNNLVPKH